MVDRKYCKLFLATCLLTCLTNHATQAAGCKGCPPISGAITGYTEIEYKPSTAQIINPERGGLIKRNCKQSNPNTLALNDLKGWRKDKDIDVILRQYIFDQSKSSDITASFLTNIEDDFKVLREAGFKAVIRFGYTTNTASSNTEPQLAQILAHIAQLKPLLQTYYDVIVTIAGSFVGVEGDWYKTSNFGDRGAHTPTQAAQRTQIVEALLDALPESRMIEIPQLKWKKIVTGQTEPLTLADYRNPANNASRIGIENRCFVGHKDDFFTFDNRTVDDPYFEQDSKYVPVTGRTCRKVESRSECPTALAELDKFHWSMINRDQESSVIKIWKEGGCYDDIMDHLGYKLRLVKAVLPDVVVSKTDACFRVDFINDGYAAPINPREVVVVFRSKTFIKYESPHITQFSDEEPWLPERGVISVSFSLKLNMIADTYEVLLWLKDPANSHPDYSILMPNEKVVELDYGLNNLQHKITILPSSTCGSGSCPGLSPSRTLEVSKSIRCASNCDNLEAVEWGSPAIPSVTSTCTNNRVAEGAMESLTGFIITASDGTITASNTKPFHGTNSFEIDCRKTAGGFVEKIVQFAGSERVKSATVLLWGAAVGITGLPEEGSNDFALLVTTKFGDGSSKVIKVPFTPSNSEQWERKMAVIDSTKNIKKITVKAKCKNANTGKAYFDEMAVFVNPVICEN